MNEPKKNSTLIAWYFTSVEAPLGIDGFYDFGALDPVKVLDKGSMLWRVVGSRISSNIGMLAVAQNQYMSDPLRYQLSSDKVNGVYAFPNPELAIDSNPIPENLYQKPKSSNNPIYLKSFGKLQWSPSLVGITSVTMVAQFQIETITDKEFLTKFNEGCI